MLCLLRRVDWGVLGARLVILFGSALRSSSPRDVDLVVFADEGLGDEVGLRVLEEVERVVGREADVYVVADVDDVNCFLLLEALRSGVVVYRDSRGLDMLVRVVGICNDFIMSRRKVRYTETLVGRVLGRDIGEAP